MLLTHSCRAGWEYSPQWMNNPNRSWVNQDVSPAVRFGVSMAVSYPHRPGYDTGVAVELADRRRHGQGTAAGSGGGGEHRAAGAARAFLGGGRQGQGRPRRGL